MGATLSRVPGGSSGGNGYSLFSLNSAPLPSDSLFSLDSGKTSSPLSREASTSSAAPKKDSNKADSANVFDMPLPSNVSAMLLQSANPPNARSLEDGAATSQALRWRGLCDDPNDPDDDGSTSYASSGMDAIHRGGGGRRGGAMARGFFNSVQDAIPGGGLIPAITGHDTFGCEMSGWSRVMSGASGVASLAGAVGHFGPLISGPGTEAAAGAAAVGRRYGKGSGDNLVKVTHWNTPEKIRQFAKDGDFSPGTWVMKGGKNWWNYWNSGVIQLGYKYEDSLTKWVPKKSLLMPDEDALPGWINSIKGALGQRRYYPPSKNL